ncbi:MAG: sigma-70 family RNA polymerase sigma factor [Armatimonadetes bacterium]|nr:sigma-70 family RNA polymerase sigma factor [Armatimonadota bacterium]
MGTVRKLSEEEIQERLSRYAKRPDPKTRDEIVLQYSNLVESIGRRFTGACEPLEDLVQEGYVGLIASVDKFDGGKGVKFSTYATHFIVGQIKHYLRDKGKIIKEPAWLQELNQRMTRVIESLNQKHGRQPYEKEIAEVMQMPESTVREMLTTREVFKVTSLDGDKDEGSGPKESEKITDQKLVTFQLPIEDKIVLETALDRLKDIEQQVIADHFYKGLNQTEIAKKLDISCNYVSHILRNGTKKLRKILATDEIRDAQMQRTLVSKRTKPGVEDTEQMSVLDSTTGLYNRQYFLERLDEEISRACRDHYKLALMLVSVEFPEGMDSLVRMVRLDDYLYNIGQSMRRHVRKMDVMARFGETCFALLMPHTAGYAKVVAERLQEIVSSIEIDPGRRGQKLTATARTGIAKYSADAPSSREMLTKAAENLGVPLETLEGGQTPLKKAA